MSGNRERILEMIERHAGSAKSAAPVAFGRVLHEPGKILVVPSLGVQGFAFAFPSIALLRQRFPRAALHVLADEAAASVYRDNPLVDGVHVAGGSVSLLGFRGLLASGRALAREDLDITLWLDREVDNERRLVVLMAGGKARVGHGDGSGLFNCEFRYTGEEAYVPLVQLALTRRLVRESGGAPPRWRIDEKTMERARQLVHFWKPRRQDYLFVVDPGRGVAGVGPTPDRLALIVELLKKTYPCKILLLSDPGDADAVRQLAEVTKRWEPAEIPQKSFAETTALLAHANLLVSGNTALFHFAWALGVPALGFFGRGDEDCYVPPAGGTATVIRSTEGIDPKAFLERVDRLLIGFSREVTARD
jgi:ADP-heptose:LPS heptosyltransferase